MDIRRLIDKGNPFMLKIGVVGVGHLGKIHLKCIRNLPDRYELAGFFDTNAETANKVELEFGICSFPDLDALINVCDVVDIVAPTSAHFQVAMQAISAGKHLFIEKPIASTPGQADEIVRSAREKGVKVQVGHVERFNPAFLALSHVQLNPMFIEAHRLAPFNPRGTDVSVVLDLMIHDLDIVLSLVQSPVRQVHASGVPIVSKEADICNARIEFENGCVANVTASRVSLKQMRKLRLFQSSAYVSMDFLEKEAQIIQLRDAEPAGGGAFELPLEQGTKWLEMDIPEIQPVNAIEEELKGLHSSIVHNEPPAVTAEEAADALRLAYRIADAMPPVGDKIPDV